MDNILLARIDPFNAVTGLLVPYMTQRIRAFAEERISEMLPEMFTRNILARLHAGDPSLLVMGFLQPNGSLVGHLVAEVCSDNVPLERGGTRWVFVLHCKADGNVGDAVKRAMHEVDAWAKERSCQFMLMATHRSDKAWERRYGFELSRHVLRRDLDSGIDDGKEQWSRVSVNTGGSTQQTSITPGSLQGGQAADAIATSGGSLGFMQPSPWYQLSPQSQQFQTTGMNALNNFLDPSRMSSYFNSIVAPAVNNQAILSGQGRGTGADLALGQAGSQYLQGMGSLMPNLLQSGMSLGQAGQGLGQQDLQRRQQLYQSLLGLLPSAAGTTITGQQQGPGTAASLMGLGGSLLFGGLNPLVSQLLGPLAQQGGGALAQLLGLGGQGTQTGLNGTGAGLGANFTPPDTSGQPLFGGSNSPDMSQLSGNTIPEMGNIDPSVWLGLLGLGG
jgi:hypothetical protein